MSWIYRNWIRPVLFAYESEHIHNHTLSALGWLSHHPVLCEMLSGIFGAPELSMDLWGVRFENPIGLAAGMDKAAKAVPIWSDLGFGFSELGGVTRAAQAGNPSPRMFRAVADQALINRMGFNNPGADALAKALSTWKSMGRWPRHPVGVNLGKSKDTPLEDAAADYAYSFRSLWDLADFFVVNVSSPNTPNLRRLQDQDALSQILHALQEINRELSEPRIGVSSALPKIHSKTLTVAPPKGPKPILVKVAPDLDFEALDEILAIVPKCGLAGIVATNTMTARPNGSDGALRQIYAEAGGLSGAPLRARSTEVIRHIYRQTGGKLPIIGVGGIFNAEDAWEKITAGASLLQIYTGLVYEGPTIVKEIVVGLREKLILHGASTLR